VPNRNSHPTLIAIIVLLATMLACSLISEDSTLDERPLLTEDRPTVLLLAPANGNAYAVGAEVTIHAVARDLGPGVARIEVIIGIPGQPVELVYESPNPAGEPQVEAVLKWQATGNQSYLVEARAYRADDTASAAETVRISVQPAPDILPPVLTPEQSSEPNSQPASTEEVSVEIPNLPGLPGTVTVASPVRQAPDPASQIVMTATQNEAVNVVGRSVDGTTWYVIQVGDGYGWILQQFVLVTGDASTLPIVDEP
jgi:hypothetical protein